MINTLKALQLYIFNARIPVTYNILDKFIIIMILNSIKLKK